MDEPYPVKAITSSDTADTADAVHNDAPVNSHHTPDGTEDPSSLSPLSSPSEPASALPDETRAGADSVRITIPSRSEYVRVVRLAVLGLASRMAFSYDDVEDIKLAVSEACNNAILHADAAAAQGASTTQGASIARNAATQDADVRPCITVTLTSWPDRLEISVADEGRVPPPGLTVPSPPSSRHNVPDAELQESGLGLFLMEALMDTVEHQIGATSNTVVRLVKYTRHGFSSNTSR